MNDRSTTLERAGAGRGKPPRVKGLPVLGSLLDVIRDPPEFLRQCASAYGDVCEVRLGTLSSFLVSSPELIEDVLVTRNKLFTKDRAQHDLSSVLGNGLLTSEGDFWRRQRRLSQPSFHGKRIDLYAEHMVASARRAVEGWRTGRVYDLHRELLDLTMEVVAKSLFDTDVTSDTVGMRAALDVMARRFESFRPSVFPILEKIPTPAKRRFKEGLAQLDAVIYEMIARRRATGRSGDDLLSMLMSARDDDGGAMSDRQLRDEVMTLFLAGHETTASSLLWSFYLLAQHPEVMRKLQAELDAVLGGEPPRGADLARLPYLEAVLHESMRLYPPAWAIGREATIDMRLGDFDVPKETQIWISQYVVHRNPRFFAEPDRFTPERWLDGLAKRLPKYAYFPFGGGPRVCIGGAFAMMESSLVLATVAQKLAVRLEPGQHVEKLASVTLRPKKGVLVRFEHRARRDDGDTPRRTAID